MHTIAKKIGIICTIALLLATSFSVVYAEPVQLSIPLSSIPEAPPDEDFSTGSVVIYRYGPDGTIQPVNIDVTPKEGQTLEQAMIEKCQELLGSDEEIQNYIQTLETSDSNASRDFAFIFSWGRGFHFQFPSNPLRIKFLIFLTLQLLKIPFVQIWQSMLLRALIKRTGVQLFLFCRYPRDKLAITIVAPFLPRRTVTFNESHSVLCLGFVGYTGWLLPRARAGRIIPHIVAGVTLKAIVKDI